MDDTTGRVTPRDPDETEIRTQEIREEIAQTRIEMSETIEAIEERLRPSNLVAQAGETVRNAATEKVRSMANTAGQAADRVMDTSIGQTVRANPIPVAMIGIGTAWLLMKRRSDEGRRRNTSDYDQYRTAGAYAGGDSDWRRDSSGAAVGTTGFVDYGSAPSSDAAARVPEFGGEMPQYRRDTRRSLNFERVIRDNPLVVGAAAALVGAAIGMSLPASETENRLMGEARDSVVDRAREAASDAAERVQDVAGKAADAATQVRDAARRTTGTVTDPKGDPNWRPSSPG
jgi:hypothetical protein